MRVISIWQPYASLLIHGFKHFETRPWPMPPALIGEEIGIASTKQIRAQQLECWQNHFFLKHYCRTGLPAMEDLPHGYLLGTLRVTESLLMTPELIARTPEREIVFGEWTPGRYAFRISDARPLETPIRVRGQQGIWTYEPDKDQSPAGQEGAAALRRHLHAA